MSGTSAAYQFDWTPQNVEEDMLEIGQLALAQTCVDVAVYAKIDPPYKTGRYQRSIRVVEPGYDGNDYDTATDNDLLDTDIRHLLDEIVDGQLEVGSYLPYSYFVQLFAKDPSKRHNILQAVEAVGTQYHYEQNFHNIAREYGYE